jgi:hypothetical protein
MQEEAAAKIDAGLGEASGRQEPRRRPAILWGREWDSGRVPEQRWGLFQVELRAGRGDAGPGEDDEQDDEDSTQPSVTGVVRRQ